MYDMYHWDQPEPAARGGAERPVDRAGGPARPAPAGGGTGRAAQAVQVALDRRDNGGDPGAEGDK